MSETEVVNNNTVVRNTPRPKLKGAYHRDVTEESPASKVNRVDVAGVVYVNSGTMPPAYTEDDD